MERILHTDIPYAIEIHPRLTGDLYLPAQRAGAPVALVIHGGGWTSSDKSSLSPVCEALVAAGVAVFAINYRRLTEAPWPACREDCESAFELLRRPSFLSPYGLKADKVIVVGASAGGHLALMTALARPAGEVEAVLAIAPPTRLDHKAKSCDPYLLKPAFFEQFFGPCVPVTAAALAAASPLGLVGPDSPPLWLIHSRQDQLVPPQHSEDLAQAYCEHKRPVRLHFFEGTDTVHGLWVDNEAPQREFTPPFHAALTETITELVAFI